MVTRLVSDVGDDLSLCSGFGFVAVFLARRLVSTTQSTKRARGYCDEAQCRGGIGTRRRRRQPNCPASCGDTQAGDPTRGEVTRLFAFRRLAVQLQLSAEDSERPSSCVVLVPFSHGARTTPS